MCFSNVWGWSIFSICMFAASALATCALFNGYFGKGCGAALIWAGICLALFSVFALFNRTIAYRILAAIFRYLVEKLIDKWLTDRAAEVIPLPEGRHCTTCKKFHDLSTFFTKPSLKLNARL